MDRLQSMRVFVKVVEQGSFAAAAQALNLSNAVVTRLVADLESYLGARLLNRSTRRMSLTEVGQAYQEKLLHILNDIDEADSAASIRSHTPGGTLSLYSHIGFGQAQLPALLEKYTRQYPNVTLEVSLSDRTIDLVEEGYDVGIFSLNQKFDANMVARPLGVAEVMFCATPEYLARHGVPRVPDDLSTHACLNFSAEHSRNYWAFESADGAASHISINSKMISNNSLLLGHCALKGMGIAMRASYTIGDDLQSGRLVRVLPEFRTARLTVHMVYPSRRFLSATVRSFVDFMTTQFPHPERDPWSA